MSEYNENQIQSNELERITQENERISNEVTRKTNDIERVARENLRVEQELERIENESDRVNKENIRKSAEEIRVENEEQRQENEAQRIVDEAIRAEFYDGFDSRLDEVNSQLEQNAIIIEGFNSESIIKAIEKARIKNINKVYFPRGTYDVDNFIPVYSDMTYISNNAIINCVSGGSFDSSGMGNGCFINTKTGDGIRNVVIDGFIIQCNRISQHGIRILGNAPNSENIIIKNNVIYNPLWDGIIVQGSIDQVGGNCYPWLKDYAVRKYLSSNNKCINENIELKTRTAFMVEHVHDAIVENCYATGFNTGYHIEGSSDCTFNNCIAEDNNNDWQRADNTNYGSDFMLGRSINVSLVSCIARRINNDKDITYSDGTNWTYKNIYMPSPFQDGLKITNCSFVGGEIRGNEAYNNTEDTRFGQTFNGCNFNNVSLVFLRQNEGEFFEGLNFINNSFKNSSLTINDLHGGSITNNTFSNTELKCIELNRCKSISIANNTFKGGDYDNSTVFRKSQLVLYALENSTITSNSFITDNINIGFYSIGFNGGTNNIITNNTFNKITENAIKEQTGSQLTNSLVTNNNCVYTGTVASFTYLLNSSVSISNNMVNGTIKKPLLSSTEWIAYDLPRDINIPANSSVLSDNIVCDGAVIGDVVMVSPPVDCNGVGISCYVLSTNRLKMVLTNSTSSDVVLIKTGWRFKIIY